MEYGSTFMWERQSGQSRNREEELREEMRTTVHVRKAARLAGTELGDDRAERLGVIAHHPSAGGPVAVALTQAGATP